MKSMITQFSKISKVFFKEHKKEIKDILLFGSLMRGKLKPKDIDILLIFKTKINKEIEYKLRNLFLKSAKDVSVISKTEKECLEPSFDARESILFEGYSLINSGFIAEDFGFTSFGLFLYNTKQMNNTMRTRFYYALNGRSHNKGVLDKLNTIKLSDNIIATPLDKIELTREFLEYWGIKYRYVNSLIPKRMARKEILEKIV